MTDQYRIVHLSDIHFGQECGGRLCEHKDVRNELLRDACRLRKRLGDADAVIVTGDTAYSGKREEYEWAGDWLSQLCGAVGCPEESVYIIPGNHDIDWSEIPQVVEDQHELVANVGLDELDSCISSRFYSEQAACNILLNKLNNYREFANRYGKDFESCEKPYWTQEILALEPPVIRFVGLNTVLFSGKHDVKGHLVLGQNQYVLRRDDDLEYIVLLHHPLDWLKDGQQARNYLESRARVWLTGHEHTLRVRQSTNEQGFEWLEVCAGATNPPAVDGYEFRYNWLTLSVHTRDAVRQLVVSFWPRVWRFSSTEFVADQNRLGGQERRDFHLALSGTEAQAVVGGAEQVEGIPSVLVLANSNLDEDLGLLENEKCITRDDKGFRRLQFLFWKKLNRKQRVQVLDELDILPDFDFPLTPIWIRRGLDAARHQGKLHELWNSVMSRLPIDQRESNPFSPLEEDTN